MDPTVAIINQSTQVTDDQVRNVLAALQMQVNNDFEPLWRVGSQLVWWDKSNPVPSETWALVILDNSDQAGALGYHELTASGDPLGKVFVADDIKYGLQWSVTASHELLEMLADPWINLCAQSGNRIYGYEVCDACEDDSFGYDITIADGTVVHVSDFVTPSWFQDGTSMPGPYDYKGHVTSPLQILQNGYISVCDLGSTGWSQLNGEFTNKEAEQRSVPKEGHRRHRRAMDHKAWKRSER